MFRTISVAIAAAVLTTGAVAALADTGEVSIKKVSIDSRGDYCIVYNEVTGSRLAPRECHSKAEWQKEGVTFNR